MQLQDNNNEMYDDNYKKSLLNFRKNSIDKIKSINLFINSDDDYYYKIEKCIYNYSQDISKNKYNNKFFENIYDDKIYNFINDIILFPNFKKILLEMQKKNIEITCDIILDRKNINPIWKHYLENFDSAERNKNYLPVNPNFKCKYCGSKSGIQYSYQVRSADEPMTVFNECQICKRTTIS